MALSGTIKKAYGTAYEAQIRWTAAQNVSANTFTIHAKWYIVKTGYNNTTYNAAGSSTLTMYIGSVKKENVSVMFDMRESAVGAELKLYEMSAAFSANSDGTLTVAIGGTHVTRTEGMGTLTVSQNISPDRIPRASKLTLSTTSLTAGESLTATVTPAASGFTHKLVYYCAGGGSSTTVSMGSSTSTVVSIPIAYCNYYPYSLSGYANFKLQTYSGSVLIGESSIVSVKFNVPSYTPNAGTLTVTPSHNLPSAFSNMYLQGISKAHCVISNATSSYGAHVPYVAINGNLSSSLTYDTAILSEPGEAVINAYVFDSRYISSASISKTITVTAYTAPSFLSCRAYRATNMTEARDGTELVVTASAACTSLGGLNTVSAVAQYKENGAASWSAAVPLTLGTPLRLTASAATDKKWDVRVTLTDTVGKSVTQTTTVSSLVVAFDAFYSPSTNGYGISFGRPCTFLNTLDARDWTGRFASLLVNGSNVWTSGTLPVEYGTWTPTLVCRGLASNVNPTYTCSSKTAQYYRIGRTVYINLQMRSVIITNVGTGYAAVRGMPYTPMGAEYIMTPGELYGVFATAALAPAGMAIRLNANGENLAIFACNQGSSSVVWRNNSNDSYKGVIRFSGWYLIN